MDQSKDESEAKAPSEDIFECSKCGLHAKYDYYGNKPYEFYERQSYRTSYQSTSTTAKEQIVLLENCYTCRDPFEYSGAGGQSRCKYLQLGSNCCNCANKICMGPDCSLFYYKKRFCIKCALSIQTEFPAEIQIELKKHSTKDES
jgi:hypothetical protein